MVANPFLRGHRIENDHNNKPRMAAVSSVSPKSNSLLNQCDYAYNLEDSVRKHMKSTHMGRILQDGANSLFIFISFKNRTFVPPHYTYGSVSAGREKWPFNVLFFKVEPPFDQT